MSEDPVTFRGGFNLYAYVGDNPVSFWDPFGLQRYDNRGGNGDGNGGGGNGGGNNPPGDQPPNQPPCQPGGGRSPNVGDLSGLINNPITHLLDDGLLIAGGTIGPWIGTPFLCEAIGPCTNPRTA